MSERRVLLLILAATGLLSACQRGEGDSKRLETFPVRVEPAQIRNLEETITLVGSIKARDEAQLFSRVPGKLLKNLVKEGDRIAKNAPVALVERDEVGVKFEPAPVPSTLTGVVARIFLDTGANVTLSTPIAFVVDPSEVLAQGEIPERYSGRVAANQEVRVRVDAYPDRLFDGKITRLSPVVDATTRSTYMEASLKNPAGLLRSGMFAKVEVVLVKRDGALSVPLDALLEGTNTIFVSRDGKAEKRDLSIGLHAEKFVEVKSGLAAGEKVVTFGLFGLKDGSALEILP
ncbi:MAG: efflux RND transporter periplasmic adaptor subunit [Pseudomonadota bacterium]